MLIKFEDITKQKLAEAFQNSGTECIVSDEDNEIYLSGGDIEFPIWVRIDDKNKRLSFFTYLKVKNDAPIDQIPNFLEKLNQRILVQFTKSVDDDNNAYVNGYYYMYTNFGIILPQLLLTAKKFSEIFIATIRDYDSEDVFF